MEAGKELDKYSIDPSNLKLPSDPRSLSLPSSALTSETIDISNLHEKDKIDHRINEVLAKNGKMKEYCQKENLKDNDTVFPSLNQRNDAFRSINHVSTKQNHHWLFLARNYN